MINFHLFGRRVLLAATVSIFALFSVQDANAGSRLSKGEATNLIVGNTISGKHFKGSKNNSFIAQDGTVSLLRGGKSQKGVWKFNKDGAHCVKWDGKNKYNCLYIVDKGNGKYEKVKKNGKVIITFHMIAGKMEGL